MTDCEKLVEFFGKKWQGHGAWTEVHSEDFYEARELAARVAEELTWLEGVNANLREQLSIRGEEVTTLAIENASLRAKN